MTKQLFSDLNDLAAEQVHGGFKTMKVDYSNVDGSVDGLLAPTLTINDTLTWNSKNGGWNTGVAKGGKNNTTPTNNIYPDDTYGFSSFAYTDQFGNTATFTNVGQTLYWDGDSWETSPVV